MELGGWTWATLQWKNVQTTAELLALRARQLERRKEDIDAAIENIKRSRLDGKQRFDKHM